MKKTIAILLCLLMAMTVAAAQAEYIYNVTIVMDGLGMIPMEADEAPVITPSGIVIIKCEGEYYFASIDNVIIMVTEDDGEGSEEEFYNDRKIPKGDFYMVG